VDIDYAVKEMESNLNYDLKNIFQILNVDNSKYEGIKILIYDKETINCNLKTIKEKKVAKVKKQQY